MNTKKERNFKRVIFIIVKFQQFLQRGEILDHNVVVAMTTIVMTILTNNSTVILVGTFHGIGACASPTGGNAYPPRRPN